MSYSVIVAVPLQVPPKKTTYMLTNSLRTESKEGQICSETYEIVNRNELVGRLDASQ